MKIKDLFRKSIKNHESALIKEKQKYKKLGFDFDAGMNLLNSIFKKLGHEEFNENTSAHYLLFCCLHLKEKNIKNILEIGTYLGESTRFLSELFKESKIITFDLADDDPIFKSSYERNDPKILLDFLKKRKSNLISKNIKFIQSNSFFIPSLAKSKFDLIWVDGDHLLPTIAWDICNSYHLCKKNGWIMFDDIIIGNEIYKDGKYGSGDAFKILDYLYKNNSLNVKYFYKRHKPSYLDKSSKLKKFVSIAKKLS